MTIRAGRRVYKAQWYDDCCYPGYTKIKCLIQKNIAENEHGSISPYETKNKDGIIIENLWQFAKACKQVPKVKETISRYDKTIAREHPKELHIDDNGKLTPTYYTWKKVGEIYSAYLNK